MNLKIDMKHYPNVDHVAVIGSHTIQVWTKNGGEFRVAAAEYVPEANADRYNAVFDELTRVYLTDTESDPVRVWADTAIAYAVANTIEERLLRALPFLNDLTLGRNTGPHKKQ